MITISPTSDVNPQLVRKPYVSPQLTTCGNVAQITGHGGKEGEETDGDGSFPDD